MIRFNLLPWRERQRQAALRRFRNQLLASALAALCAVTMVDQLARQRAHLQATDNRQRAAALAVLSESTASRAQLQDQHATSSSQLARFEVLRAEQRILEGLFTDLERALPTTVQLLGLQLEASHLRITGLAPSGAVIAQFMRDLDRSGMLIDLQLKQIESLPRADQFLLTARVAAPWS
ncbi:PilN domain-containing protein [Pseudomonas putida]|uniref:PilN domain-containing protein n=1 Tax=Pseudomonas putida TaxID=303 RepID=UPI0018E6A23B|nr:PilN domain-containing protein [Pseudomonas putida]MBI6923219.1 PilN domain-containing protein [Pseudomonas putida]